MVPNLQEMGAAVVANFPDYSVDENGVVSGSFGIWTPIKPKDAEPLDTLFKIMRLAGLDPGEFQFQQYTVVAANPYHANRVDLKFPAQLVIKSSNYTGIHQLDLVLRSPFVCAVEISSAISGPMSRPRRQGA